MMSEDKSVFKIPSLARQGAYLFGGSASLSTATATPTPTSAPNIISPTHQYSDLYLELSAISEEILSCRNKELNRA